MKAFLEKTCRPFALSKNHVSIFRIEKNDKFKFIVRLHWDGMIKDIYATSHVEALYKFYFNLCWLLDDKTMSQTMDQRVKGKKEIDPIKYNLQEYF